MSPFYRFVGVVSRPVLRYLYRLRVRGLENLPDDGGFVLASNHISNLDPFVLGIPLFPKRQLRFMGKAELWRSPLRPFVAAAGAFPVRRGEADRQAVETAVRLAREGDVVAMFPEGTRKKGLRKKFERRWHTGAARIALEAGVPLVPAAITGTERLSRFEPLRIVYGHPLDLDDLRERDPREAAQAATERLREEIAKLAAET